MKWILRPDNIADAIDRVTKNKGAPGIDKMTYAEVEGYFAKHGKEIWEQGQTGTYKAMPVRRIHIPKPPGKKRPLGIPVVVDRVVQHAIAQVLSLGYEQYFSNNSFGYRPGTGAQHAVDVACTYLDEGFEWVVDLDIEKFFDTKSGEAGQASAHKNRLYIRYILEEEAMSTKNKQIHDQKNGLTHTLFGDNYLTDLQLSSTEKTPLGHYGRIRLNYLRKHRPGLYTRLILSGKLYEHLTEIDRASRQRMEQIISRMSRAEGVDEMLKATDQMS